MSALSLSPVRSWLAAVAALVITTLAPQTAAWARTLAVPGMYPTIQEAVNAANSGDTVLVAPGTYAGSGNRDIDPAGRDIVFLSQTGSANTVIDCETEGRGFHFHTGEGPMTLVQGFTIMNGDVWYRGNGGAVLCVQSSPRFMDSVFQNNAAIAGGGVHVEAGSPVFINCKFIGNRGVEGAAVEIWYSRAVRFQKCAFYDNRGQWDGGVTTVESDPQLTDCEFTGNVGGGYSCGVCCWYDPAPVVTNCTLVGNRNGPVFRCAYSSPTIENCIAAFNRRAQSVDCWQASPIIVHSLFYGNTYGDSLSCGEHHDNLFTDPLLCDYTGRDFSLCADSPCLPEHNPWGVAIGARGEGCGACVTAVREGSWGAIKNLFR